MTWFGQQMVAGLSILRMQTTTANMSVVKAHGMPTLPDKIGR